MVNEGSVSRTVCSSEKVTRSDRVANKLGSSQPCWMDGYEVQSSGQPNWVCVCVCNLEEEEE